MYTARNNVLCVCRKALPELSKAVQIMVVTIPHAAANERTFSGLQHFVSGKRCNMLPTTIDWVLCLVENWKHMDPEGFPFKALARRFCSNKKSAFPPTEVTADGEDPFQTF